MCGQEDNWTRQKGFTFFLKTLTCPVQEKKRRAQVQVPGSGTKKHIAFGRKLLASGPVSHALGELVSCRDSIESSKKALELQLLRLERCEWKGSSADRLTSR